MPKQRNTSNRCANEICDYATITYDNAKLQQYHNERVWDICHSVFIEAYNSKSKKKIDYDYLALHLSAYLAFWGMFRGSAFINKNNYREFIPVIEELLKEECGAFKYICLLDIKFENYKAMEIKLLFELRSELAKILKKIRNETKENDNESDSEGISQTLITKILLATLGCVPAYDRYLYDAIVKENIACGTFGEQSIMDLKNFYQTNSITLETTRHKLINLENGRDEYPQAKLLDMGLFEMGRHLESVNL